MKSIALVAVLIALPLMASEPPVIEERNFVPETGWNRSDAVLQVNNFFLGSARAHEVAGEIAIARSARHQAGYTLPVFSDQRTGVGDALISYRYQLVGDRASRVGIAPRLTVVLPTRSENLGGRVSGLQFALPVSLAVRSNLALHTNFVATRTAGGPVQWALLQRAELAATERLALIADAAWTHCAESGHRSVVRPGLQYSFDGPGGSTVAPGVAMPVVDGNVELLFFLAFEQPLN